MSFISELKRRNVIRMAGLYLVGAWLIAQIAETLLPIFHTPEWVLQTLVTLLAIGFIPALVFAWVFELTPDGLKRDEDVVPEHSIAPQTARRMERVIIGLFTFALIFFAFDKFVLAPKRDAALVVQTTKHVNAKAEVRNSAINPHSIAVLPFVNMSGDKDNEYFSDGISEEILNVLARTPALQVAARTSSFAYKGKNVEVPEIARELKVRMVLEGSVRKQGENVRITAQLIDASNGYHVWSQTYDRNLQDIFVIQDEIAKAIADELKVRLNNVAAPGKNSTGTSNLAAYDLYLKARILFLNRQDLAESDTLLQQALNQDPNFAKAWELRAAVNTLMDEYKASDLSAEELDLRSAEYAQRALAIDPQSSLALAALANVRGSAGRSLRATVDYVSIITDLERAIEIDPHNVNAMNWLGITLALLGDSERALAMLQHCVTVDPTFGPCMENQYDTLWVLGRADEAYAHMVDGWSRGLNVDGYVNFALLAHFEQRSTFLLALTNPTWLPKWRRGDDLYEAFRHLDRDHSALRKDLQQFLADREKSQYFGMLLVPLGAFDQPPPAWLLWSAEFKRYRQSPQFKDFSKRSGALAYWKAKGFPKGCRATGNDKFECD